MEEERNQEVVFKYLQILCKCYSTGFFEPLFPYLSDDIIMESQWVFQPNTGREEVEDYFIGKGETLRKYNRCPECEIVELLSYNPGELCMYMSQDLNDKTNGVIVILKLNDKNLISRIDLCMPELFPFKPYRIE